MLVLLYFFTHFLVLKRNTKKKTEKFLVRKRKAPNKDDARPSCSSSAALSPPCRAITCKASSIDNIVSTQVCRQPPYILHVLTCKRLSAPRFLALKECGNDVTNQRASSPTYDLITMPHWTKCSVRPDALLRRCVYSSQTHLGTITVTLHLYKIAFPTGRTVCRDFKPRGLEFSSGSLSL